MSMFAKLIGNTPASPTPPAPAVVETPPAEAIQPDDVEVALEADLSIKDMNKDELEAYGRTVGLELDRRHSRKKMTKELEDYLEVSDSLTVHQAPYKVLFSCIITSVKQNNRWVCLKKASLSVFANLMVSL